MKVIRLKTESHLEDFASGFAEAVKSRSKGMMSSTVPLAYLRRCNVVRGVFDGDGKMLAGYAIGASTPLRLLEFVPEQERAKLQPPRGASWDECSEIVCMWRREELTHLQMDMWVWPKVALDAIHAGRPFILGHNENKRLDRHYTRPGLQTLYTGPSSNGLDSHLLAYTRARMWAHLLAWVTVTPLRMGRWFFS